MLLKTIEIHGFKSFADKTELDLGTGVTCLVGPNGCGKSNVVDALKWALGEQRASALRGDNMGDVVFKGNGNRPPMSFAEVTLIFDNSENELPVETAEVSVTRRLARTGESQYLINRRPVRLKDVKELFFDTGLGQNAYSVLEQGRIDGILRANAVERRTIFEEAAGIQRFRMRKREAARKLERVDQNLLRVADLIEELERRVRSLKVQAGRARSYVELTSRLTELKTQQFLASGAEIAHKAEDLAARLEAVRAADAASEQALLAMTQQVAAMEADLQTMRDEFSAARTRSAELNAELEAGVERRASLRQRQAESEEAAAARTRRIDVIEGEVVERREALDFQRTSVAGMKEDLLAAEGRVEARRAELTVAEREDDERAREYEAHEQQLIALADQEMRRSNELAGLDSRLRGLRTGRERLVRREAELAALLERVLTDAQKVRDDLSRLGEAAREQGESIGQARARLEKVRARESVVRLDLARSQSELAAKESRRDTLDSVIEEMEGVDEGSRALVKASREDADALPGVRGLLAELMNVPRARASALDTALGALAGAVVVEDRASLDICLEFLRRESSGPATFLVLNAPSPSLAPQAASADGDPLLDGIKLEPAVRELLEGLIGDATWVSDDDAVLKAIGSGRFLISKAGMRLERGGALRDRPQKKAVGFVERKVERDQLTEEVDALRKSLHALQEEEARLSGEVTQGTVEVAEAEQRQRDLETGIRAGRSEDERLQDRAAIFRRELSVSAHERLELEDDSAQANRARRVCADDLAACRADRQVAEQARMSVAELREEALEQLNRLSEAAALAATEVIQFRERVRGGEGEIAVVERALHEQEAGLAALTSEREELRERARLAAQHGSQLEESVDELRVESAELSQSLDSMRTREDASLAAVDASRREALNAARAREQAREGLHQCQLEERELVLNQTALRERAQEEISLDIDACLVDYDPTQQPPRAEIEREFRDVRDKVARLGNVNLDAISELEQVEERLTFLIREREDLDGSRKSLAATIKELDLVSRDKFLETFEAVRENFRVLFRKLFHGGSADIRLEEGNEDVLEAGIDIFAGPPGKDPRSITLLSGGERTMTAVALLFALFKARPAPIAVLDEVDAALDEANIERFCSLLDDFIGESQFLIVTHSKRTMSYADVIFGVTMQESGVSKRIGIRMEDYEQVA